MNAERLNYPQAEPLIHLFRKDLKDKKTDEDKQSEETEVIDSEEFDLGAFFGVKDESKEKDKKETDENDTIPSSEQAQPLMPDLLVTLRDDANESIATLTTKITAESFAAGASLTSSVFSALGSLVGSCGVFCAHSLSALGQAGSGLSGASGLAGGLNMPGFSVDKNGNFHLDGNIDTLSRATGISKGDLLSGKFSAEDILTRFFSAFGEGISLIFGFGLVGMLIDCLFDSFLPSGGDSGEMPLAA